MSARGTAAVAQPRHGEEDEGEAEEDGAEEGSGGISSIGEARGEGRQRIQRGLIRSGWRREQPIRRLRARDGGASFALPPRFFLCFGRCRERDDRLTVVPTTFQGVEGPRGQGPTTAVSVCATTIACSSWNCLAVLIDCRQPRGGLATLCSRRGRYNSHASGRYS